MLSIDLNCDMGESFGAYILGQDDAIMDYVSSVNVACGFHAGDATVMKKTVALAASKNIAIGAHPGYPDLQGFGRRDMKLSPSEIYDIVVYQIGALDSFARIAGTKLHHVKPHGALYNAAAKDHDIARAIAQAVKDVNDKLVFTGLSGSALIKEAKHIGLRTASEVFADRTYQDDGTLTSRALANATIEDSQKATQQVLQMVMEKKVTAVSGRQIEVEAQTVCIHGDGKHALAFAQKIFNTLKAAHVDIKRP